MDSAVPGLERALWALQYLADHPQGSRAADLVASSGVPRATLYRILRVLRAHHYVVPLADDDTRFVIGPAPGRLARKAHGPQDLLATVQPLMDALSTEIGETVKFVVRDKLEALTLAVSPSARDSCIASRVGTRLPLHVGASQRLLLAHAPAAVQQAVLGGTLARVTARTLVSADVLRAGFAPLQRNGHATGHSEGVEGVGAFAALVRQPDGEANAAIAAVYIHAGKTTAQRQAIARATLRAAARATGLLAG